MNAHMAVDTFTIGIYANDKSTNKQLMLEKKADILDAYILKNEARDLYIMRDKCIDNIVEQTVLYIRTNIPGILKQTLNKSLGIL